MEVTFANNSNRIYFNTDGEDGGTIAAADSSGNPLETGASVGHGADVTFTAEPESDYMVESWTVDGEVYTWPGTDEPYRESTLTLENISADRTVTVSFERAAQTTVHTGVVDVDGQPSSAATISVTNAGSEPLSPNEDGTYTVRRDTSLIFTAHLTSSDNNTVREWQSSTDGVAWTTIAGSGGQDTLTVYNLEDEHLYIRAVVATAQNFSLSWKVQMSEGEVPEEANASLTAVSNGVALTSGSHQPAYVAVDFTLTLSDAYYVVNWSGNVDSDGTTARLESLTADTEVTVTIAKKPTVTIAEDVSGGSVTVKGTVNGVADTVVANGGYVDNGTAITITTDPPNGYVVNTINGASVNSDRTNGSKDLAVENVTADISATATFLAKPTVTIGSAVGGTVTATGTVDGSSLELSTGSYVDFGTEISVTLAPATGYVVDTGAMGVGDLAYTDGFGTTTDNRTYTIGNVQENQSIEPKWEALETYAVTYSVVDTNGGSEGGTNGTLSASASRKNMEGYSKPSFTSGEKLHEVSVVALTAVPNSGYRVQEWRVNGDVVQTTGGVTELGTSLTLENIAEDTEISVQFVEIGDRITVSAGSGGRITSAMVSDSEQLENIEEGFTLAPNAQVVITAQPDAGYEVAGWSVNGVEVPGESALSYGMTNPYQNILKVESLSGNLAVQVEFESYEGYAIPTGDEGYTIENIERNPDDTTPETQIRKGGDVTFTVGLNVEGGYANFSKLVINGYDCLTGELVDEETGYENCDSVTATRNSDGCYTVTIQGVNSKITTDIEAHQLVINEGLENYDIPESLIKNGIDSIDKIQTLLSTAITGSYDGITYMDIALMYWDGSQWVVVTEMPEGGVDVVVPYDTINTEATSNDTFTVAHMLTTGENAGQVDIIEDVRKESDGLHFHVNSLSPFAISWTKYEAPVNPGGGDGGTPTEPEEPALPFTDVAEGDWWYDAVAYVYENNIMAGTDETVFDPYMELDRAQAAQLFYNLEGKPAVTGDSTFTDVTSGHWAVDAITWAAQNDIVVGIGGNLYDPDSNVTREQFAVMLYKYARFKGYDLTAAGDLTQFPDAGSISSWAETALSWANGKGLINGNEDGTLAPGGTATRAQAASILANFDQNVAK